MTPGPDPETDGVVRWRCSDLAAAIKARFGADYHESSIGKLLRFPGFSHVSARPRHPRQDPETIGIFKNFPQNLAESLKDVATDKPVEIWFRDDARVGQKNGQVYKWAAKGSRPRQASDQRYENTCIFGAVCPARDKGAALGMPHANTEAMQKHLEEISASVAVNAHGVVIMDRAGWHKSGALNIPENLSILFLPPIHRS